MAWAMQHCFDETETKLFLKDRHPDSFHFCFVGGDGAAFDIAYDDQVQNLNGASWALEFFPTEYGTCGAISGLAFPHHAKLTKHPGGFYLAVLTEAPNPSPALKDLTGNDVTA